MANPKIHTDSLAGVEAAAKTELQQIETELGSGNALAQALPFPDVVGGGGMLVLVILVHAFFIRLITSSFLKRSALIRPHAVVWRADMLFAWMVVSLLTLHLAEVLMWAGALVYTGILPDWSKAAYFAGNCYTTMGEPFALPHDWRIVPPIIAMSGIFTTAWTASVLVNFVARYNDLRAAIMEAHLRRKAQRRDKT